MTWETIVALVSVFLGGSSVTGVLVKGWVDRKHLGAQIDKTGAESDQIEVKTAWESLAGLQAHVDFLEEQLARTRARATELDDQLTQTRRRVGALEDELDLAHARTKELNASLDRANGRITQLERGL